MTVQQRRQIMFVVKHVRDFNVFCKLAPDTSAFCFFIVWLINL